jgi:glycosyltransferase involved in cell wall biosynthesis
MLENRLVSQVDVLTTITHDDALAYSTQVARRRRPLKALVLTPGYEGQMRTARHITAATPRHVAMLGSFRWSIKQENLRRLLAVADAEFARHGIVLDIIGDVPEELRNELSAKARATRFHGFVADPAALLEQARIALVPEVVGSGFKLKLLDYMFARVPVFSLKAALAGLPDTLRAFTVNCDSLEELIAAVIRNIDDVVSLDELQNNAASMAQELFRWQDRGTALANLIAQLRLPSRSAA